MWGLEDIKNYRKILAQMVKNDDYTLRGENGACFIKDDLVIKVYEYPIIKEKKCDLSEYTSNNIAFPKYYIKSRRKYYGEVMPYFPYKQFYWALDDNISISRLLMHYFEMVEEIKKFSNIHMDDLEFHGNILYDKEKGFYLIDTTKWQDEEWSCTEKFNIKRFNCALLEALKAYLYEEDYFDDNDFYVSLMKMYHNILNTKYGYEFKKIMEEYLLCQCDFSSFIIDYAKLIKNCYQQDVETVQDVKNHVKELKKQLIFR